MLGLLTVIIQIGSNRITQGFFIVVGIRHKGVLPLWMSVTAAVAGLSTNTFVGPIYATGFTLFYFDQRIRKEGFDIEHMMQPRGNVAYLAGRQSNSAFEVAPQSNQGSGHE